MRLTGLAEIAPANDLPANAIDDPDEETVADNLAPDEEPTTIRPTPIPPDLVVWESTPLKECRGQPRGHIGKYELYSRLARGAFGVVYTAYDPSLDRSIALKVLRPTHLTNHDIVQRFLQEARATARVAHPGIVTIHDCGMVETRRGSTAFIAMELLSGESLTSRLVRSGRLGPAAACEIARQVASALEAAHHVDVLHRDLKPDNIYLVPDPAMPSGERVKVLDFGLAKLGAGGQTQLQTVFGTPRYMSPEQTRSATQIDHRSDIYSLGCILFELVTGRSLFDGDVRQLLERHQRATPPRTSSFVPEVSPVLDNLVGEMVAKDPMARPQTMGAVQRALRLAIEHHTATEPSRSEPPARHVPPPALPAPSAAPAGPPRASTSPPIHPTPPVRPPTPPIHPTPPVRPSAPPIRPSTSPIRPSTSPPVLPPPRPPSSPPIAVLGQCVSLPSIEISITPTTPSLRVEHEVGPVRDVDTMSGEIVVPALPHGLTPGPALPQAAPQHATAAYMPGQLPQYRGKSPTLIWLGLLVLAVLTVVLCAAL